MGIKAVCIKGMVNIDCPEMAYSNIKNMYKDGDGTGIQVDEEHVGKEKELMANCDKAAKALYRMHELLYED